MTSLAKWKPGRCDEPWKLRIAFKNRELAIDTINGLLTIVYGGLPPGVSATDYGAQCEALKQLSMDDVVAQLRLYWDVTSTELTKAREAGISTLDTEPAPGVPVNISGKRITED